MHCVAWLSGHLCWRTGSEGKADKRSHGSETYEKKKVSDTVLVSVSVSEGNMDMCVLPVVRIHDSILTRDRFSSLDI